MLLRARYRAMRNLFISVCASQRLRSLITYQLSILFSTYGTTTAISSSIYSKYISEMPSSSGAVAPNTITVLRIIVVWIIVITHPTLKSSMFLKHIFHIICLVDLLSISRALGGLFPFFTFYRNSRLFEIAPTITILKDYKFVAESSDIVITILSQDNDYNAQQALTLKNNILKQSKSIRVSIPK